MSPSTAVIEVAVRDPTTVVLLTFLEWAQQSGHLDVGPNALYKDFDYLNMNNIFASGDGIKEYNAATVDLLLGTLHGIDEGWYHNWRVKVRGWPRGSKGASNAAVMLYFLEEGGVEWLRTPKQILPPVKETESEQELHEIYECILNWAAYRWQTCIGDTGADIIRMLRPHRTQEQVAEDLVRFPRMDKPRCDY
ncbi:hypothetical protein MMC19_001246 [Ptychographa xylographoides]|nr:hypothetical protein [Ptychographa xylographoides]